MSLQSKMRLHARTSSLTPEALFAEFRRMMGKDGQPWPEEQSDAGSDSSEDIDAKKQKRSKRRRLREKRSQRRFRAYLLKLENALTPAQIKEVSSLLEDLSVEVQTLEAYRRWGTKFVEFCNTHDLKLAEPGEVDDALCACFNTWYLQGQQAHVGDKTLAAVMFMDPRFSFHGDSKLPRARKALKGWRAVCPGRSRLGHPLGLWACVMVLMENMEQVEMAVLVAIALSAYLRPSEVMGLRKSDLVPPAKGL